MARSGDARPWGTARAACERVDQRFESYLDDELSAAERREVDLHLEGCAACREELALAESVVQSLRSLPRVARGPSRTTTPSDAPVPWAEPGRFRAQDPTPHAGESPPSSRRIWSHPLLQAAAVLLLLSGVWLAVSDAPFDRPWGGDRGAEYSEEELRAAEEDLRIALSYFGGLAEKAGLVVRDDVLGERVVEPTRRAFRRIGELGIDAADSTSVSEVEKNP